MKRIVLVFTLALFTFGMIGCAPTLGNFSPKPGQKINPTGLYVIVDSTASDDVEKEYRGKLVDVNVQQVKDILTNKGYQIVELNDKIDRKDVYSSCPGLYWYISEKKIAKASAENGCETVLIIHYSLENAYTVGWKDLHKAYSCNLHFLLVNSQKGNIITQNMHFTPSPAKLLSSKAESFSGMEVQESHKRFLKIINESFFGSAPEVFNH